MPRKQRNELTAGIFIVAAVALLLVVTLWVGAAKLFQTGYQEVVFYVNADETPGLKVGSVVTMGGVKIGQIIESRLVPADGKAYYVAQINRQDVVIHADSNAHVAAGLVGEAKLAIDPGSDDAPIATAETPIHVTGGLDQGMQNLNRATQYIAGAAQDVETITGALVAEADVDTPGSVLSNIKSATSELDDLVSKLYEGADNLARTMAGANTMIARVNAGEGSIGQLLNSDRFHRELLDMADQLTTMMEEAQALLTKWREEGVIFKLN